MDGQLEAVRQDIGSVKNEIIKTKPDLAAAEQAGNKEKERVLWDVLLNLNNQLSGLQEEENIAKHHVSPASACTCWLTCVHIMLHSIQCKRSCSMKVLVYIRSQKSTKSSCSPSCVAVNI